MPSIDNIHHFCDNHLFKFNSTAPSHKVPLSYLFSLIDIVGWIDSSIDSVRILRHSSDHIVNDSRLLNVLQSFLSTSASHIFHRKVNYKDHAVKDHQQIIFFERLAICWFCHEKILTPCINQTPFSTMNVVNKIDATKYRYALLELLQLVSSYFLILNKSPSS